MAPARLNAQRLNLTMRKNIFTLQQVEFPGLDHHQVSRTELMYNNKNIILQTNF